MAIDPLGPAEDGPSSRDILNQTIAEANRVPLTIEMAGAISRQVLDDHLAQTRLLPRFDLSAGTGLSAVGIAALSDDRVIYIFWIAGQSLAAGATSGAIISSVPVYPGRALMPDNGLHHYDNGLAALVSLQESVWFDVTYETIASSFANHLIRDMDAELGGAGAFAPKVACFVAAKGGTYLPELKQGTETYRHGIHTIQSIAELAARDGMRVEAHVLWIQGESDIFIAGGRYREMLLKLQADLSADIRKVTGQIREPVLFLSQTNRVLPSAVAAANGQRLQQQQLEAAQREQNVCQVGPIYAYPVNPADHIHKTSLGTYQMGAMFSRAVMAKLFGLGWEPLAPQRARFATPTSGAPARIVLDVHVPVEPLVLDTSGSTITVDGMADAPGYGFDVYDSDGNALAIDAVTILQASTAAEGSPGPRIAIDLEALPATESVLVTYAGRRDAFDVDAADDGPVTGARGCIRDSAAHVLLNASTHHNWMVHWHQWVTTPASAAAV